MITGTLIEVIVSGNKMHADPLSHIDISDIPQIYRAAAQATPWDKTVLENLESTLRRFKLDLPRDKEFAVSWIEEVALKLRYEVEGGMSVGEARKAAHEKFIQWREFLATAQPRTYLTRGFKFS
tara:strand:- start:1775 stop:2146 length:372 start_codon:yes stop_codon:yes gene_type:complete